MKVVNSLKNLYVFVIVCLTILNSDAVYQTFMLYWQLYHVNKEDKTVNFCFLNRINVLNVEVFVCIENIMEKNRKSLNAAISKF